MATVLKPKNKLIVDATNTQFPSLMQVVKESHFESSEDGSFYYGFVSDSTCKVSRGTFEAKLTDGMYFAMNSGFKLECNGTVVLFKRLNYSGLNAAGGPLESVGRQRYIDGCTSSLLFSPVHLGDCCFNYLFFPANTIQSKHFHPSIRLGVVTSGHGYCHVNDTKIKLEKGDCFYLEENEQHYFSSQEVPLSVVAYHPDSDWGPTHEIHPMLNRTFIKK